MKINVGERACLPLSPFLCKERDVKRIIEDGFVHEREGMKSEHCGEWNGGERLRGCLVGKEQSVFV